MKIKIFILIIAFLTTSLSGCQSYSNFKEETFFEKYATEDAEDIFYCFQNEDIDSLSNYFCDNLKNKCDLNADLKEAFDFIEGDIIDYSNISISNSGIKVRDGEIKDSHVSLSILNIHTSSEKIYEIGIRQQRIFADDIGQEGIDILSVRLIKEDGSILDSYTIE